MLIPTLNGWSAGEKVTASKLTTQTKTAIENAVYYKPYCEMALTSSQSLPINTSTKVGISTVVEDTDGMASASTSEIIIKTAGRYRILGQGTFSSANGGYRIASITKNGASPVAVSMITNVGQEMSTQVSRTLRLAVNDRITLTVTTTIACSASTGNTGCFLSAEWISL